MLKVQEFLLNNGLEKLKAEYNITACQHPTLPLVILNYSQLDKTNKFHPIVRECRGLTLELDSWDIVARSFDRFYNWGEYPVEQEKFDWGSAFVQEKIDGSLAIIYNYKGEWTANTRGSFGTGQVNDSQYTWHDLVQQALGYSFDELRGKLSPHLTYICELVSPYNKIVTAYKETALYLLSVFHKEAELGWGSASFNGFKMPDWYHLNDMESVQRWLETKSEIDPTFEGVVAQDIYRRRIKVKSLTYLGLHRIRGNGNEVSPKNVIHAIMQGNGPEMAGYFPEVQPMLDRLAKAHSELCKLYYEWMPVPDQKTFALGVKDHPLCAILFNARKNKVHVAEQWEKSEDILLKFLEREN